MAQLVVRLPGRHEVVGSNPCRCVTFLAESIPVLSGRLVCCPGVFPRTTPCAATSGSTGVLLCPGIIVIIFHEINQPFPQTASLFNLEAMGENPIKILKMHFQKFFFSGTLKSRIIEEKIRY